jgi:hypothetical protein
VQGDVEIAALTKENGVGHARVSCASRLRMVAAILAVGATVFKVRSAPSAT